MQKQSFEHKVMEVDRNLNKKENNIIQDNRKVNDMGKKTSAFPHTGQQPFQSYCQEHMRAVHTALAAVSSWCRLTAGES